MCSTKKTPEPPGSVNRLHGPAEVAGVAEGVDAAAADAAGGAAQAAEAAEAAAGPGDVAAGVSREHFPTTLTDAGCDGRGLVDPAMSIFICGTACRDIQYSSARTKRNG